MNFTILALFIIVIFGTYLRLLSFDSVQGLWNDEYVSWYISQKPLLIEFAKGIFEQCHMPLYYLYLKFITYIFGNSDVVLRLSSLIIGVLSIIVMYFVGKVNSNKLGLLCAFFTAISGILIYFSYEVRPYQLIFLFSELTLLYSLKLVEKIDNKNLILYIVSTCALLFTHTLAFLYVICNLVFVGFYIKDRKPNIIRKIILFIGIFFLLLTPIIINIITTISYSQWWSRYSFSKLLFFFTDIFSNYLINIINAPNNFISVINVSFIIFAIVPTVICILGLLNIIKVKNLRHLLFTAFVPLVIVFFVSMSGKLVFLTKYNFEIYPVLIYLSMMGILEFKNLKFKIILLTLILLLNTGFLFSKDFKQHFYKPESNKLVAELLYSAKLKPNDIILFTYYPRERFSKYFDYSKYEIREVHKGNFFYYLTPKTTYKDAVINGDNIYKNIYKSNKNDYFSKKIENEFYENLISGRKIAVIYLNSVSFLSDIQLMQIAQNNTLYKKVPQMYLIFSYVKNFLIKKMYADLKIVKYEENGDWSMIVFEKL